MNSPSKIGRLPRPLQHELNRRLHSGQSSTPILAWLNALPEVSALLQAEFNGAVINKQNLSDWRAGGLREWQARQETVAGVLDYAGDAAELDAATEGRLADRLATMLAFRYAQLLQSWDGEVTDAFNAKQRALRSLVQDVAHLRSWDHSAARVRLEAARHTDRQEMDAEALFVKFEEWATKLGVQDYLRERYDTPEEKEQARRQLLKLPPLPREEDAPPDPVDPEPTVPPAPAELPVTAEPTEPADATISAQTAPPPKSRRGKAGSKPSSAPDSDPTCRVSSTPPPEPATAPNPLNSLANSPVIPPPALRPVEPCQPPSPNSSAPPGPSDTTTNRLLPHLRI